MLINFVDATNDANHYTKPQMKSHTNRCIIYCKSVLHFGIAKTVGRPMAVVYVCYG